MATLSSSVPGVITALLALAGEAASEQAPVNGEQVGVFAFDLGEYEPAAYILITEIKGPRYEWEAIGSFAQKELYEIHGRTSVYTGDSAATRTEVALETMRATFSLFGACVMTPVITRRDQPVLGTEGPSPYLVLPEEADYSSGPAGMAGGQAGRQGTITWAFHFEALITPS